MAQNLDIKRGAGLTLPLAISAEDWSPGDKLLFGAKLHPDDDITDANAKMKKTLTNNDIVSTHDDSVYFDLVLHGGLEGDTDIPPANYIAEFKHIHADGQPEYFEPFELNIVAEINRRMG